MPSVTEARVPDGLHGAAVRGPVVDATREEILLRIPRLARFLVRADRVRVERMPAATDADVQCFLDGPVAAAAALLRGAIPLHAAAVNVDGRAVAITGLSGSGKSAVAAALALRGHDVLADAVTVLDHPVRPLCPRPVLWPDMVEALGLDPAAGHIVRPALRKRAFDLGPPPDEAPLRAVVLLVRDALHARPASRELTGTQKAATLLNAAWFRGLVAPLGLERARFAKLAQIAAETQCLQVVRPRDNCSPADVAELLEDVLA
jgi:hypothetical protein